MTSSSSGVRASVGTYGSTASAGTVLIMTFTSPFCPYGPQLKSAVQRIIATLPGVKAATVNVVFTPPWDPRTMATEECKIALGLGWDEEPEAEPDIEHQR